MPCHWLTLLIADIDILRHVSWLHRYVITDYWQYWYAIAADAFCHAISIFSVYAFITIDISMLDTLTFSYIGYWNTERAGYSVIEWSRCLGDREPTSVIEWIRDWIVMNSESQISHHWIYWQHRSFGTHWIMNGLWIWMNHLEFIEGQGIWLAEALPPSTGSRPHQPGHRGIFAAISDYRGSPRRSPHHRSLPSLTIYHISDWLEYWILILFINISIQILLKDVVYWYAISSHAAGQIIYCHYRHYYRRRYFLILRCHIAISLMPDTFFASFLHHFSPTQYLTSLAVIAHCHLLRH